jgi:hypothetical protein
MIVFYTVKKIYRIPVFFFTKPFRKGKTPMLTRDFLIPSREGIFCLLRREKYSSLCRGNFFLFVECYISLFPLFPYKIYRKINGRFLAGHRSPGQSSYSTKITFVLLVEILPNRWQFSNTGVTFRSM